MRDVPVEEARARMLSLAEVMPAETVSLDDAHGRVLAKPVTAMRDQPPFSASAMDGWAVRAADAMLGARLKPIGESAAGRGFSGRVGQGTAVRIFTGAPVPEGANAVVIQENTRRDGDIVVIEAAPSPGANIRPAGGDFRAGEVLLDAGSRLDPWRLALCAAAGRAQLSVARRPRVAILSTGDEIVLPGETPGPHQIFNSGAPALAALVRTWGGEPAILSPAADDLEVIRRAVAEASCEVIVTVGGASVGDHDLVKPALAGLGLALVFETVRMRPGKPTSFGTLTDGRRVLGLPGNPASAMAGAELFLRPLLCAMTGADPTLPIMTAKLAESLPANGPREHWMRARLSSVDGEIMATPFADQDSSLVSVFAGADALLRRPAGAPEAEAGETVNVLPLARL